MKEEVWEEFKRKQIQCDRCDYQSECEELKECKCKIKW